MIVAPKVGILFLAANPSGTDRIALGNEARSIQSELELSGHWDYFQLETRWITEPRDLVTELRRLKPAVVHFSGHGDQNGLFFQAADGRAQIVSTAAFAETFGAAGASVKLVVLNACYTETQAEALLAHVDSVVGMGGSVREDAARSFAAGFYAGLAEGASVAVAFERGIAASNLEKAIGGDRPHLKVRNGGDATRLHLDAVDRPHLKVRDGVDVTRLRLDAEPGRVEVVGLDATLRVLSSKPDSGAPPFVWLHVSDIHFGAGDAHWRFDQKVIARAIVEDAAAIPWTPDRIFVTGDIAFSGKKQQYELAYEWLLKLARSARTTMESVRVVPGNHDVDRDIAKKVLPRSLHTYARGKPLELDELLQDEDARKVLSSKLHEYMAFLARLGHHPPQVSYGVDWIERISAHAHRHGPIRIVGLSSVWVSDAMDGQFDLPSSPFVPNMLVGLCQLDAVLGDAERDELIFVLTHHPPEWMKNESAEIFARGLARRRHIHLSGHVHSARARYAKDFGLPEGSFRYVAGAAHGDPRETNKHGYAWGALRIGDRGWEVGWAPRAYVPEHDEMRSDSTNHKLDEQGFAWQRIDLPWQRYVAAARSGPEPPATLLPSPGRPGLIDFRAERQRHVRFVGREDVLSQIDRWLEGPGGGEWVVVSGGPGMGKSAILSAWLARREAAGALVPHHFVRRHAAGWDQPEVIAASLAAQIEALFPGPSNPAAKPEQRLLDLLDGVSKQLGSSGRLVIMIDGLDQTRAEPGENPLPRFLPPVVPTGIRVLCSTRPSYLHLSWLETGSPVRLLDLDARQWAGSNEAVVRGFWEAVAPEYGPSLPAAAIADAIARAEGNVMHAEMLHRSWRDLPEPERRVDLVPRGIQALISEIWDRSVAHEGMRVGLGLLCAAREALSLDVLAELAGWNDSQKEVFKRETQQLLLEEPRSWAGSDAYRPRHDWIRELMTERLGAAAIRTHHKTLLEKLATWPPRSDSAARQYAMHHALAHRVAFGDWDWVRELASNLDYLDARARAGELSAVEQELADARVQCPDPAVARDLAELAEALACESHWIRNNPEGAPAARGILPGLIWNRLRRSGWTEKDLETRITVPAGAAFLRVRRTASLRGRASLVRTLEGHAEAVTSCAVTPDGRRAVSASDDRTLKVWDLDTGRLLITLDGHGGAVTACAVTSDGRRAISASADRTLKVWDLNTGRVLATLEGHAAEVRTCAITPDDRYAVSASDDDASIKVWDLTAGRLHTTFDGYGRGTTACAVTSDGRGVVSASAYKTLKVWDLDTGRIRASMEGHAAWINACAVTSDGRRVISASSDKTLKVWALDTGRDVATLKADTGAVTACAVMPGNRRVISASDDGTLKVWDLDSAGVLTTLEGHRGVVTACAVTPGGRRVVSAGFDRTVKVWTLDTAPVLATPDGHAEQVNAFAVTPDGHRLVSAALDRTLKIWDLDAGHVIATLAAHRHWVNACTVTPDGQRVISASEDGTLKVWNFDTCHVLTTLEGHANAVRACAVTPDGQRVVSASHDRTLKVWDLATGRAFTTLEGHADFVNACAVTLDGRRAISASADHTLKIWDLDAERALTTLDGHTDGVSSCALTPDGRRIVSASDDGTLKVWDIGTGHVLATLEGHVGVVSACAVMPNGRHVVSASADRTLRVWDLLTASCIFTHRADTAFQCVVATADHIIAGDSVGTVWFLEWPLEFSLRHSRP